MPSTPPSGRRVAPRRPVGPMALLGVIAALLSPGCLGLYQAHVPASFLGEWRQTDEGEGGSFLNIAQEYTFVVYEFPGREGLSGPYPGSLSVLSLETLGAQSREELTERLEEQLTADAKEQGIVLDPNSRLAGSRTLASGLESRYFTYRGTSGDDAGLFAPGRQVRVVGEVFTDERSGIHVIAVGFAQTTGSGSSGGFFANEATWRGIVADPRGTIDNAKAQDGLLYNVKSRE